MGDIYEPPKSNLESDRIPVQKLSLFLLIVVNTYYWPKLIQYLVYFKENIDYLTLGIIQLQDIIAYSIGIPVYVACALFIFNLPIGNKHIWRLLVLIAIADEIYAMHKDWDWNDMSLSLFIYALLLPLYLIGLFYAFGSKNMWMRKHNQRFNSEAAHNTASV